MHEYYTLTVRRSVPNKEGLELEFTLRETFDFNFERKFDTFTAAEEAGYEFMKTDPLAAKFKIEHVQTQSVTGWLS